MRDAQSQFDAQQRALDDLQRQLLQAKVDHQLGQSPVIIIALAEPPEYPSAPNHSLDLMIAIAEESFSPFSPPRWASSPSGTSPASRRPAPARRTFPFPLRTLPRNIKQAPRAAANGLEIPTSSPQSPASSPAPSGKRIPVPELYLQPYVPGRERS